MSISSDRDYEDSLFITKLPALINILTWKELPFRNINIQSKIIIPWIKIYEWFILTNDRSFYLIQPGFMSYHHLKAAYYLW